MCRFINADEFASTGQGFIGHNMFAYCNNSPTNYLDASGDLPGQNSMRMTCDGGNRPNIYGSADEAAMVFANSIYSSSRYIRHEYSALIYSSTFNGQTVYHLTEPLGCAPHFSRFAFGTVPEDATLIAATHTHPNSDTFSGANTIGTADLSGDIKWAVSHKLDMYVVGPNFMVQKYCYSQNAISEVGMATPIQLTPTQKQALRTRFEFVWYNHYSQTGTCPSGFDCPNMTWPNA